MRRCIHRQEIHAPNGELERIGCTLNSPHCPCISFLAYNGLRFDNEEGLRLLILKLIRECVALRWWDGALWWCEAYGMEVHQAAQLLDLCRRQGGPLFSPRPDYSQHPGYVRYD